MAELASNLEVAHSRASLECGPTRDYVVRTRVSGKYRVESSARNEIFRRNGLPKRELRSSLGNEFLRPETIVLTGRPQGGAYCSNPTVLAAITPVVGTKVAIFWLRKKYELREQ